ncbi:FAD dependent oxidoreductase [Exophiala viscosa]|uniref:FAD dependent oxidoreductase n=1 Tax=Exophiala viscosa TaxID=2486360 RepID=UPI0021A04002|nr:FAD dependent oxidoreductase [Exophiala viscosa]
MPAPLEKNNPIIIVGAGTWGCSTSLHLARRGYTDVTVFDPFPVPSIISAGNDINKVLEAGSFSGGEDEAVVAQILLAAAKQGWRNDPVFSPYFHDVGYILAASSTAAIKTTLEREINHHKDLFTELSTAEDFRATMPPGVLTGEFPQWKGWLRRSGVGWVHARKAMVAAYEEAGRLGVKFVFGNARGKVESLLYQTGDVRGVRTADGIDHSSNRVILAAGAYAPQIFDFENQLRPTAWTLAHIQMSPEEAKLYRNLPVLFHSEKGFFMEPDEDNLELKVCDEYPGYCNWVTPEEGKDNALPYSKPLPRNKIPVESARRIRRFLSETMPHLADRPFSHAATIWCADTSNRAFLITQHPRYESLILAAGDSGHGFTHLPSIGGFVADLMWRPEVAQGFWGDDVLGRSGAENRVIHLNETASEGWIGAGSDATQVVRLSKL